MKKATVIAFLALASIAVAAVGYEADLSSIDGASDLTDPPLIQGVKLESGMPPGIEPIEPAGQPSYARLSIGRGEFTLLLDRDGDDAQLYVDRNGDGKLLAAADSHERFTLDEPFNIDGTTYVVTSISPDGARLTVDRSDDHVDPKPPLLVGYPAPTFEAIDVDGNPFALTDFRGEILVLDFWAGWCTPCIEELDILDLVAATLSERGGALIGIDLDRSFAAFLAAVDEHGITYRQVYDGPDGPISTLYRIGGIPMIYLIDEDGIIRGRDLRGEELIGAVDALRNAEEGGK